MTSRSVKIVYEKQAIQKRVQELAEQINKDYADKDLIMIGMAKRFFLFSVGSDTPADNTAAAGFYKYRYISKRNEPNWYSKNHEGS